MTREDQCEDCYAPAGSVCSDMDCPGKRVTHRDPSCVGAFMRAKPEHITDGSPCWCDPELDYVDPNTGVKVWVHKGGQ